MPIRVQQKFNDAQFVQTSVHPNARVPHEINTTGRRDMSYSATAFGEGAITGTLHPPARPLPLNRLLLMEGVDFG
jgi:hypothetical protein